MVSSFFPEWRRKNLIACPKWVRCGDPTLNRSNSSLALKLAMVLATVFWALGLHTAVQYDLKNFVALGLPCVRKPSGKPRQIHPAASITQPLQSDSIWCFLMKVNNTEAASSGLSLINFLNRRKKSTQMSKSGSQEIVGTFFIQYDANREGRRSIRSEEHT